MKTTVFCFGKFYFLLAGGDMLEQNRFQCPGFGLIGRQYYTHPPLYRPNDLPTRFKMDNKMIYSFHLSL